MPPKSEHKAPTCVPALQVLTAGLHKTLIAPDKITHGTLFVFLTEDDNENNEEESWGKLNLTVRKTLYKLIKNNRTDKIHNTFQVSCDLV